MLTIAKAMGVEIPSNIPLKDTGAYAGQIQKGGGSGAGRQAKAAKLQFQHGDQVVEFNGPRIVEEFIFRHLRIPEIATVTDLEEYIGHSVFETPWEFGDYRVTTQAEKA